MGIRENIDKYPRTVTAIAVIAVALAVTVVVYSLSPPGAEPLAKAYYTDDDGKTWFVDTVDHVSPFDHDGKTAVKINLYVCEGSKQIIGSFLERYKPDAKKKLEAEFAAAKTANKPLMSIPMTPDISISGTEVKTPLGGQWVSRTDFVASAKVTKVECPDGGAVDSMLP